jgi:hypothetical protein
MYVIPKVDRYIFARKFLGLRSTVDRMDQLQKPPVFKFWHFFLFISITKTDYFYSYNANQYHVQESIFKF